MKKDALSTLETAGAVIFAAALPFSVTLIQGGIILFAAAALLRARSENRLGEVKTSLIRLPLGAAWAAYLAAAVAAAIAGINTAHSLRSVNSDILTFAAFAALCVFLKPSDRDKALAAYLAGVCAAALIGSGEALYGLTAGLDVRARAGAHPVRFGEMMAIGLSYVMARLSRPGAGSAPRGLYAAAMALLMSALLLSQTRGAYLGAATMIIALAAVTRPSKKDVLVFMAASLTIALFFAAINPVIRGKFGSLISVAHLGVNRVTSDAPAAAAASADTAPDSSIGIRLTLWKTGFRIIKDKPAFGVGPGNFRKVFTDYCPPPYPGGEIWGSLHNIYIHQAAERGLAGLAALLCLFGGMFLVSLRNYRLSPSPLTLWALILTPAWFVMNLTEISFQHVHTSYAVLFALAVSIRSAGTPGDPGPL